MGLLASLAPCTFSVVLFAEDEASDDGGWDDEGGWEEDEGKSGGDSASAGGISGKTTGEAHDEYDAGKIPQGLVQRVEDDLWELRQLVKFEASKVGWFLCRPACGSTVA